MSHWYKRNEIHNRINIYIARSLSTSANYMGTQCKAREILFFHLQIPVELSSTYSIEEKTEINFSSLQLCVTTVTQTASNNDIH